MSRAGSLARQGEFMSAIASCDIHAHTPAPPQTTYKLHNGAWDRQAYDSAQAIPLLWAEPAAYMLYYTILYYYIIV